MLENKFKEIKNSISSLNTNINNSNNNNNNQVYESVNARIIPSDHIAGNEGIGYRYQNE